MTRNGRTLALAIAATAVLAGTTQCAIAQIPGSALKSGSSPPPNAPSSALTRPGALQAAPMVAPNGAASPLQRTDLPSDLAHMNDNAIIIVGGSPMSVAAIKRQVLSLDDKAIIIVGGKQVPASALKQQIGNLSRANPGSTGAAPGGSPAPARSSSNAVHVPRLASELATRTAPRRVSLLKDMQDIRADQDRAFQNAVTALARNPTTAARAAAQPTFVASSQELRAGIGVRANALGDPGIVSLNGRISNIRVTPGGKLLISGNALGGNAGSVRLIGGALSASPVPLTVIRWRGDAIEAEIPAGTRGVPDESHAAIEVRTAGGQTYRFDGVQFVAAREEQPLSNPARIAQFWSLDAAPSWPSVSTSSNTVSRVTYGKNIDCPRTGSDVLRFARPNGFEVVALTFAHGRTDSGDGDMAGNPGGRVFFPGYKLDDWTDEVTTRTVQTRDGPKTVTLVSALHVDWGIFRSHTSPGFALDLGTLYTDWVAPLPAVQVVVNGFEYVSPPAGPLYVPPMGVPVYPKDANDYCSSDYAIASLTVYGPAGVNP